jgi:hypothetical protein
VLLQEARRPPNLILLDVQMPFANGLRIVPSVGTPRGRDGANHVLPVPGFVRPPLDTLRRLAFTYQID